MEVSYSYHHAVFKSKSTGFNEFINNIATAVGEGSANPTEPHHTPSPQEQQSHYHDSPPSSHPTTTFEPIPQAPTKTSTPRRYTRRAIRIAQSKALSPAVDEPTTLSRDDRYGEAFITVSSLDAGQDRENIAKTSALPYESLPRVTSLDANEGSMQQRIHELMELYTSLQRQQSQMAAKIKDQDLEISGLKARVNSMEAANILTNRVAAASVSPADVLPTAGVPTVSGSFPTASVIFTTASMVAPYKRGPKGITIGFFQPMRSLIIRAKDKGKEKVVEFEVPKKRKLQEQIDAQVAREMEEEFARENQRVSEQLARDSEIARLHAEEELKMMIEGLDMNNEVIAKHLREYEQAAVDLSVGEKLKLISELVKYQDHHAKILKYQAQQSKPLSKKEQKEFYMSVPRSYKRQGEGVMGRAEETVEPDFKDQLWTHNQAFMYDPLDWKLYDTCGVHHVSTKDQEIFMLAERDYPLRKGLATMMIILDEELIEASSPELPYLPVLLIEMSQSRQHDKSESVSLGCSGNTTRIMHRTIMVPLVFTLGEEQVIWNSVLMILIDDILALDSIVHFWFSDQRLEWTATFLISTNSE
nr:hypothetical protein [Tanacetum cinerariifolium]